MKGIRLAAVLVDAESTYPAPAQAMLRRAGQVFPTLPILLLSSRIGGFSHSYAAFNADRLLPHINTDKIRWRNYRPELDKSPEPF